MLQLIDVVVYNFGLLLLEDQVPDLSKTVIWCIWPRCGVRGNRNAAKELNGFSDEFEALFDWV